MKPNLFYPEVYFSKTITSLLNEKPPIPNAPAAPVKPDLPPDPGEYDNSNRKYSLFWLIVTTVGGIIFLNSEVENKGYLIFLIIIILGLFMFKTTTWDKEAHEKKKAEYDKMKREIPVLNSKYQAEYSSYLNKKKTYDQEVANIQSKTNTLRFRRERIRNWLDSREKPNYSSSSETESIKKGVSEKFFFDKLSNDFESVYFDISVPVGGKAYYPDILLVVDSLYIDVEIDEPYVGNDGTPIHYCTEEYGIFRSVDESRNEYLTERGFEVVRFSEDQIFIHPDECVSYIKEIIKVAKSEKDKIECNPELKKTKWTRDQANRFAYKRFRNTYVPAQFQRLIDKEENLEYREMWSIID